MTNGKRFRQKRDASPHVVSVKNKSHVISKRGDKRPEKRQNSLVPIIRIVEIFDPVQVKTDVANFRSLVQKLTGKSCCSKNLQDAIELDDKNEHNKKHLQKGCSLENLDGYNGKAEDPHGSATSSGTPRFSSSELDIWTDLMYELSLPDFTMLPPLQTSPNDISSEASSFSWLDGCP
eukprot:c34303_g1_i1 orf=249-779(-)